MKIDYNKLDSGMGGDNGITYCAKGIEMQPTDFCSYGERKDDEGVNA